MENKKTEFKCFYLTIGAAIGLPIGTVLKNPGLGVALGAAIGTFVDIIINYKKKAKCNKGS